MKSPNGNNVVIAPSGKVEGNALDHGEVFGGYNNPVFASTAATSDNAVFIFGEVKYDAYGGYAQSKSSASATSSRNNTGIAANGTVRNNAYGGFSISENGSSIATRNRANSSGTVTQDIYGGLATVTTTGTAKTEARTNSVTISGGSVRDVYGGAAISNSRSAISTENSVTINGGTVNRAVIGGYAQSTSGTATLMYNHVTLAGGTVNSSAYVFGGANFSPSGSATHNTITLTHSPVLTGVRLYGGWVSGSGDPFAGNRLNVQNYSGNGTLDIIANFQYFSFLLPNTPTPALSTDDLDLGNGSGTGSSIEANFMGGGEISSAGTFTLIDVNNPITGNLENSTLTVKKGATLLYNGTLGTTQNLTLTLSQPTPAPLTKSLANSRLMLSALNNQGADLVAGEGMNEAISCNAGYSGVCTFGTLSGGKSSYDVGDDVDLSGFSLLTGVSVGMNTQPGRLTVGVFLEYGQGSYDSSKLEGDGKTHYTGGGLLGRIEFPSHLYVEASVRGGSAYNEFNSDLSDSRGIKAKYDASASYYGFHLGTGYVWTLNEQSRLSLYGKYLQTQHKGSSVTLSTEDPVKFDDLGSKRLRLGGRWNYATSIGVNPYLGLAWENEFDTRAKSSTYGIRVKAPDMGGNTAIGELGLAIKPSFSNRFSVEASLQAYAGKRTGAAGNLLAKFEF